MSEENTRKLGIKKAQALVIAALLVVGVLAGAGIWLLTVDVPVDIDEPYTIYMSDEERLGENEGWEPLEFKESHVREETANFSASGSKVLYHQYVRIDNPEEGSPVSLTINVTPPFEEMGFTVLDGIVHPGEAEREQVQEWGSIEIEREVWDNETVEFTVIYTLGTGAPASDGNGYEIIWDFYEEEPPYTEPDSIYNLETGKEFDTIQEAIDDGDTEEDHTILVGPGDYEGPIEINLDGITLRSVNEHQANISLEDDTITDPTVQVKAEDVTIEDFVIQRENEDDMSQPVMVQESGATIHNNVIEGPAYFGVTVQDNQTDEYSNTTGVEITDNEFSLFGLSVAVLPALDEDPGEHGDISDVSIEGNTFQDHQYVGVYLNNLTVGDIEDVTLLDNAFNSTVADAHVAEAYYNDEADILDWGEDPEEGESDQTGIEEDNGFEQDVVFDIGEEESPVTGQPTDYYIIRN